MIDLESFLSFDRGRGIACPCRKHIKCILVNREVGHKHLVCEGFMVNNVQWIFHEEELSPSLLVRGEQHNMNSTDHNDMHDTSHDNFEFPK